MSGGNCLPHGYIDAAGLERLGNATAKNAYGRYLLGLLREPMVR